MSHAAGDDRLLGRADRLLWLGVLAGPLGWLLDLQASYVIVPAACRHGVRWPLHLFTLAAVAFPVLGAAAALRARRLVEAPGAVAATVVDRARFMCWTALALCALFGLLVLATGLAKVIHSPCDAF